MNRDQSCPCCSGLRYSECCKPVIEGKQAASSAEALMRSRYSAYCLQDAQYLLSSWHEATRPASIDFSDNPVWEGLQIVRSSKGQANDSNGLVEFIARFSSNANQGKLHETSRFIKEQDLWFYVDGQLHSQFHNQPHNDKPGGFTQCTLPLRQR